MLGQSIVMGIDDIFHVRTMHSVLYTILNNYKRVSLHSQVHMSVSSRRKCVLTIATAMI